jgi:hypothetical protein
MGGRGREWLDRGRGRDKAALPALGLVSKAASDTHDEIKRHGEWLCGRWEKGFACAKETRDERENESGAPGLSSTLQ